MRVYGGWWSRQACSSCVDWSPYEYWLKWIEERIGLRDRLSCASLGQKSSIRAQHAYSLVSACCIGCTVYFMDHVVEESHFKRYSDSTRESWDRNRCHLMSFIFIDSLLSCSRETNLFERHLGMLRSIILSRIAMWAARMAYIWLNFVLALPSGRIYLRRLS